MASSSEKYVSTSYEDDTDSPMYYNLVKSGYFQSSRKLSSSVGSKSGYVSWNPGSLSDSFDSLYLSDGSPGSSKYPVRLHHETAEMYSKKRAEIEDVKFYPKAKSELLRMWPSSEFVHNRLCFSPDELSNPSYENYVNEVRCYSLPERTDGHLSSEKGFKKHSIDRCFPEYSCRAARELELRYPALRGDSNTNKMTLCSMVLDENHGVPSLTNGSAMSENICTWNGRLVHSNEPFLGVSPKVMITDIPWDIPENMLIKCFRKFGTLSMSRPKEQDMTWKNMALFVAFESEFAVRRLLGSCQRNLDVPSEWFFSLPWGSYRRKEIKVIPWMLNDVNFITNKLAQLDPHKTVFVTGLHCRITAYMLAIVMETLFKGVVYTGIDTDVSKYPNGNGKVTFDNVDSYMKAVSIRYVQINTVQFKKRIQILPNLVDSRCQMCGLRDGPYFCRDLRCFNYYCHVCWKSRHSPDAMRDHEFIMKRIIYHQCYQ